MNRALFRVSGAIAAGALCAGCYTTSVRSGAAPGRTPVGYEDRWHHGFLLGVAEASGPYDIHQVCPEGWAEMRTEVTFLTGLVGALTWGIYYPQSVTFVCAATAMPPGSPGIPVAPATVPPAASSPAPEIGGPAPPPPASTAPNSPTPPGGAY